MTHFSLRTSLGNEAKLIISVSKKVAKKAVTRNLIKRRVRAAFRPLARKLKPATYMFIARAGAEEVKGEALERELAELLKIG
ncbi:ribonuclease P protein component [Candidatus Parcubacteria bacterium]|nr:ribonuclease P protein component [Candidatus Parcubacteria bacterium]